MGGGGVNQKSEIQHITTFQHAILIKGKDAPKYVCVFYLEEMWQGTSLKVFIVRSGGKIVGTDMQRVVVGYARIACGPDSMCLER